MKNIEKFRQRLYQEAKKVLQAERPEYVSKFEERLNATQNLEKAIEEAEPLKGNGLGKEWQKLLASLLDLEWAIFKLNRSLDLLKAKHVGNVDELNMSVLFDCHTDLWIFYADALAERLKRLVKQTCRHLLRDIYQRQDWQQVQDELMKSVKEVKKATSNIRDSLAHGDHRVEGIQKDGLWERSVIVGTKGDINPTIIGYYQSVAHYQEKWRELFTQGSPLFSEKADQIISELYSEVFGQSIT